MELRRVALAFKARGYRGAFLFAQPGYVNLQQDRAWCRLNGLQAYDPGTRFARNTRRERLGEISRELQDGYLPHSLYRPKPTRALAYRLMGLALLPGLAALELVWSKRLLARRRKQHGRFQASFGAHFRFARRVVDTFRPDAMVFGQDFPGSVNALLSRIGRERGIPTFIVPFAVGTTKEMCESLVDNPYHDVQFSLMNRVAARLFPRWVNYYDGKELLRLPGQHILTIEALGLAPEHPWLPNSSYASRLLVESRIGEAYYRRMRFPDEQLELTGSPSDDLLAAAARERQARKERLCRKLELKPDKPILLVAWPTDQYGSRVRPMEFPGYERLCQAWARALGMVRRTTDYTVLIRPHPVTDPERVAAFAKQYRLHVTDIDTLELVPACDLFVACVSSTLRWAIACGIPAINYDCYDYGYTDFDPAKGTFTVRQYAEFEAVLERLTSDPEFYASAARAQRECSADWAMLDGRSLERIVEAVDELARPRTAAAPAAGGA